MKIVLIPLSILILGCSTGRTLSRIENPSNRTETMQCRLFAVESTDECALACIHEGVLELEKMRCPK